MSAGDPWRPFRPPRLEGFDYVFSLSCPYWRSARSALGFDMRVFLRHARTRYYYNGEGEWVVAERDARSFDEIEDALEMVSSERLDGMQLLLRSEETLREQVFDLSEDVLRSTTQHRVNVTPLL